MAREKKSMIGFDPLAWLDDDKPKEVADAADEKETVELKKEKVTKKKATKKKAIKKNANKETVKIITLLGHDIDETALLKGYALAGEVLDEAVENFYNELFSQYPGVKPLFENVTEKAQQEKLGAAIKLLVDNLHNEQALVSTLTAMGERHQGYGALPDHYPIVAELLVSSFKKIIGRSWTKAVSAAWMELLVASAETMCAAYKDEVEEVEPIAVEDEVEDEPMPNAAPHVEYENPTLHLNSLQDISKSQALKSELMLLINDNDHIDIDGGDVERIDGTALQLLCAFFNYAHQNNLQVNWINASDALKTAVQTLGLQKTLELT